MAESKTAERRKNAKYVLQKLDLWALLDDKFREAAAGLAHLYLEKHREDDHLPPDDAWLKTFATNTAEHMFIVGGFERSISITPLGWTLCGHDGGQVELDEPQTRKEARDLFKGLKFEIKEP